MVLLRLNKIVEALCKSDEVCGVMMPAMPSASKAELVIMTLLYDPLSLLSRPWLILRRRTTACRSVSDKMISATSLAISLPVYPNIVLKYKSE